MTVAWWTRRRTAVGVGVALVVLAGVALASAGGGAGGSSPASSSPASSSPVSSAPGFAGPERLDTARDGGAVVGEAAPFPGAAAPAQGVAVGAVARELVRTAQVVVEVADPEVGIRDLRAAVAAAGGFVAQEQSGVQGGWVTARVPADGLDRLVEQVSTLGAVVDRSTTVVDATEEVVDLDARVASLQASVARVRALLAEATSIGDVVAVESELARREAELDSLTGRRAALRDQVAMSTLTVDLRAPGAGVDEPGFLAGLGAGWDGLRALGAAAGAAAGFVLPFLPVLAVLAGLGWLVRRRRAPSPATGS